MQTIMILLGGEERAARLQLGQLRTLQDKTGVGPQTLLRRLISGDWFVDDIRETIRLGLIGGGAEMATAQRLIGRHIDDEPLVDAVFPAVLLLMAAISGPPGKAAPSGEADAPEPT